MENPPMLVFSAAKQPSFITLLIQYAINKQNNQGYVTMKFSVPDYHHPILAYWRKKSYQAVSIDVLKILEPMCVWNTCISCAHVLGEAYSYSLTRC